MWYYTGHLSSSIGTSVCSWNYHVASYLTFESLTLEMRHNSAPEFQTDFPTKVVVGASQNELYFL